MVVKKEDIICDNSSDNLKYENKINKSNYSFKEYIKTYLKYKLEDEIEPDEVEIKSELNFT